MLSPLNKTNFCYIVDTPMSGNQKHSIKNTRNQHMSTLRLYALFILLLVFPLLLQGEGFQVKVIADEGDLPEKFCSLWKKDPQALIQVNHPRSGDIGYFNNYELDPDSASSVKKNFDLSFDVLEVMNGPYPYDSNDESIADWLNLLNRGFYFPIVGSSDTHTIDGDEPGYSRTYVFYSGGKGDHLDLSSLIHQMKKGHTFVSNGPVVDFKINTTHVPGDSFTAKNGKVDIWLKVESAPWVSVDEVRIIVNGKFDPPLPQDIQLIKTTEPESKDEHHK